MYDMTCVLSNVNIVNGEEVCKITLNDVDLLYCSTGDWQDFMKHTVAIEVGIYNGDGDINDNQRDINTPCFFVLKSFWDKAYGELCDNQTQQAIDKYVKTWLSLQDHVKMPKQWDQQTLTSYCAVLAIMNACRRSPYNASHVGAKMTDIAERRHIQLMQHSIDYLEKRLQKRL